MSDRYAAVIAFLIAVAILTLSGVAHEIHELTAEVRTISQAGIHLR